MPDEQAVFVERRGAEKQGRDHRATLLEGPVEHGGIAQRQAAGQHAQARQSQDRCDHRERQHIRRQVPAGALEREAQHGRAQVQASGPVEPPEQVAAFQEPHLLGEQLVGQEHMVVAGLPFGREHLQTPLVQAPGIPGAHHDSRQGGSQEPGQQPGLQGQQDAGNGEQGDRRLHELA